MVLVGFLTGLFGVGGGFLILPAPVLVLGVQMPIAVGTSLLIIVANSVAGVIFHLSGASIDWVTTGAFVGTAVIGSLIAGNPAGMERDAQRRQLMPESPTLQAVPVPASSHSIRIPATSITPAKPIRISDCGR